jgi:predicted nucleotidyltransferase
MIATDKETDFIMDYQNLLATIPKPWMKDHIILFGRTGSCAYGTNTEESDEDYKGVCIPPVSYFLGLESFSEYNNANGKNFKNTTGDIDVTVLHINKFVKDALKGVPNNIEMLFLEPEDYLYLNDFGKRLRDIRHQFLSKRIMQKFGGYARSQAEKMKHMSSNRDGRAALVQDHGYDTKFYMHTVRLLTSAIEILQTGTFSTRHPQAEFLKEIRKGKHTLDEALRFIQYLETELNTAYGSTDLPDEPAQTLIDQWLVDLNLEFIEQSQKRKTCL